MSHPPKGLEKCVAVLNMDMLGAGNGLYLATACLIAYRCSGSKGIYSAQRIGLPKFPFPGNHK